MKLFSKPEVLILKEDHLAKDYLDNLEELVKKAPEPLQMKIKKEIELVRAGIIGENKILFELKNCGMDMVVLHDISISDGQEIAQIDFYVITPKINFMIECKNLYGDIVVNHKGEFIRKYELFGKKYREGFYSPVTQNQRHLQILKNIKLQNQSIATRFIVERSFDDFHKSLIVLANPQTIIHDKYAKKEIKEQIIRADQLGQTIKRINKESKELKSNLNEMVKKGQRILELDQNNDFYKRKYQQFLKEIETYQIDVCPRCGHKLIYRKGRYGAFLGCSQYPLCKFTKNL